MRRRLARPVGVTWAGFGIAVVATDLLRVSIDRWFTTPVRTILENGHAIAQMAQDQAVNIAHNTERYLKGHPLKPIVDLPQMAGDTRCMVREKP